MCVNAEDKALGELQASAAPLLEVRRGFVCAVLLDSNPLTCFIDNVQNKPYLQAWCTKATLQRYLLARDGNVAKALAMLKQTVQWYGSFSGAALVTKHYAVCNNEASLAQEGRVQARQGNLGGHCKRSRNW